MAPKCKSAVPLSFLPSLVLKHPCFFVVPVKLICKNLVRCHVFFALTSKSTIKIFKMNPRFPFWTRRNLDKNLLVRRRPGTTISRWTRVQNIFFTSELAITLISAHFFKTNLHLIIFFFLKFVFDSAQENVVLHKKCCFAHGRKERSASELSPSTILFCNPQCVLFGQYKNWPVQQLTKRLTHKGT